MATHSGVEEELQVADTLLGLVCLLRPAPASAFTAGAPGNRAWACSLRTLAQLAALWAACEALDQSDAEEEVVAGNAISLRILIEEMLPVLSHVASLTQPASHTAEKGMSSVKSAAASLAVPTTCGQDPKLGGLPSPATSGNSSDPLSGTWDSGSLYPVDSTLQLLMAAADLTAASARLAFRSPSHYTVLAGGLQHIGSDRLTLTYHISDGIIAALDAVLSLARALVTKGAWWQEAKAHHPLLLIEALHTVAKVVQTVHLDSTCSTMRIELAYFRMHSRKDRPAMHANGYTALSVLHVSA
jgi:hypothetical protein